MAVMIGPYFFKLTSHLSDEFSARRNVFRTYLAIGMINSILLFFSPWYVKGLWSFGIFKYQPLGGPLYFVFTSFFFWCNAHAYLIAWKKYWESKGLKRKQLQLFLLATGFGYFLGAELFLQGFSIAIDPHAVFFMFIY